MYFVMVLLATEHKKNDNSHDDNVHCLIFWTVLLPDEATCLMFDCVRKVVGNLANMAITITLQRALNTSIRGEKNVVLASMSKPVITSLLTSLTRCLASG